MFFYFRLLPLTIALIVKIVYFEIITHSLCYPLSDPQRWVSGFAIHLRIGLSEVEGDAFLGALEVDWMEDCPVVEMEGDMEVVDTEFECRD